MQGVGAGTGAAAAGVVRARAGEGAGVLAGPGAALGVGRALGDGVTGAPLGEGVAVGLVRGLGVGDAAAETGLVPAASSVNTATEAAARRPAQEHGRGTGRGGTPVDAGQELAVRLDAGVLEGCEGAGDQCGRQQPGQRPGQRALEQEGPAHHPAAGADEAHGRDVVAPAEDGGADGVDRDDDRDQRQHQEQDQRGQPHVSQECLEPLVCPGVVGGRICGVDGRVVRGPGGDPAGVPELAEPHLEAGREWVGGRVRGQGRKSRTRTGDAQGLLLGDVSHRGHSPIRLQHGGQRGHLAVRHAVLEVDVHDGGVAPLTHVGNALDHDGGAIHGGILPGAL